MASPLLVILTLICGLLIGLIPTLVDGIKNRVETRLSLPAGRADWFVRFFYLAWLPSMPAAGWLLENWSNREVLFFSLVALILAVAWLALVQNATVLLISGLFLGLAYSCVATATVRLMTVAFFPDYANELNIAALNLGFVAVGIGALAGPALVAAIERWWGMRQGLLYVSVVLIAPAALTAACDRSLFPHTMPHPTSWEALTTSPHMILIAGAILVYFVLENLLEYWPTAFLREIRYEGRALDISLFIFWVCFIGTRGAAAWWLFHYPHHGIWLAIILAVMSGFVVGNLAGGLNIGSSSFGFWLTGACYGPLLPCLLGIALTSFYPHQQLPLTALGALLALSGLDTLVVRPIMNSVAKDRPARTLMRTPTFLAFAIAGPLLLLALWRS